MCSFQELYSGVVDPIIFLIATGQLLMRVQYNARIVYLLYCTRIGTTTSIVLWKDYFLSTICWVYKVCWERTEFQSRLVLVTLILATCKLPRTRSIYSRTLIVAMYKLPRTRSICSRRVKEQLPRTSALIYSKMRQLTAITVL